MFSVRTLVGAALLLFLYYFATLSRTPEGQKMAALQPLKFLSIAPRAKHTATVIFIHVSM